MTITAVSPAPATGPDILNRAAVLLSAVVGPYPLMTSDVHTALTQAARIRAGDDQAAAHRLADEAGELLAAWLVTIGEAEQGQPSSVALRGWTLGRRLATVGYALRGAAEYWRAELGAALTATGR